MTFQLWLSTQRAVVAPVLLGCALGCSASTSSADAPNDAPLIDEAAEIQAAAPERPPAGVLWRHEVVEVVDQGLGRFLQHVSVEPALEQGKFTGFRVVDLLPLNWWAGVDLRPGDVVEKVNGMPIERETQAFAAFESLRTADQLRVSLWREGQQHELGFEIRTQPGQAEPEPPVAAPASQPAAPNAPKPAKAQPTAFRIPRTSTSSL